MTKKVVWTDLTVADASGLKDFYQSVVGFAAEPVSMGDYEDYCLKAPDASDPEVGVCHARGGNADIPPVWLVYFAVADLTAALAQVEAAGGSVLKAPTAGGAFAVIRDPAGAVCALYQTDAQ
ncbi:MAG: VOC family protein [Gammaproteobacteria bacterium]|nr:VOC family protein [Gammaproteobacteria bacterium]NVK89276.1 VOC family protein [Gammaproteobacteria bacterium]